MENLQIIYEWKSHPSKINVMSPMKYLSLNDISNMIWRCTFAFNLWFRNRYVCTHVYPKTFLGPPGRTWGPSRRTWAVFSQALLEEPQVLLGGPEKIRNTTNFSTTESIHVVVRAMHWRWCGDRGTRRNRRNQCQWLRGRSCLLFVLTTNPRILS